MAHEFDSETQRVLADHIKSAGEPVYKIARRAGVDAGSLYGFRDGRKTLRLKSAERVADSLGLKIAVVPKREAQP